MSEDKRSPTRSERVYEALLLAYPKEFRSEYGWQLTQAFGDLCREEVLRRGTVGFIGLWARTLLDLAASALVERGKVNRRGLLAFGGWIAGLKGLLVVNASVVIFTALFFLPGSGSALAGLLYSRPDSLGPLLPFVVLTMHAVYPLAGIWAVVWVICYPERSLGRATIRVLFASNAAAFLLLLVALVWALTDVFGRRRWVMENFGFDPLMESMGAIITGAAAVVVYLLFALGYAYFLRVRPDASKTVPVAKGIGGGS